MEEVNRRRFEALNAHDYDRMRQHDEAMALLNQQAGISSLAATADVRKKMLDSREEAIREELQTARAAWERRLQNFQNDADDRLRRLNDRQTRELSEFRGRYQDPAVMKRFSRASRELLALRREERKLAVNTKRRAGSKPSPTSFRRRRKRGCGS
jgi:precorrin-2 methylase